MNEFKNKPVLYLFKTNFTDSKHKDKLFFCPYCTQVEGMMSLFPIIRQEIEIRYVNFEKPRGALNTLCGEANQSCPQLVFINGDDEISSSYSTAGIGKIKRIELTLSILDYFSKKFDLAKRH